LRAMQDAQRAGLGEQPTGVQTRLSQGEWTTQPPDLMSGETSRLRSLQAEQRISAARDVPRFHASTRVEPAKIPPKTHEGGNEHRTAAPHVDQYFCTNCQTICKSAGLCPTCGFVLKDADAQAYDELMSPELHFVDPAYAVDMREYPDSKDETALGYGRDQKVFWQVLLENSPELFSVDNRNYIKDGEPPEVDKTWLDHHPGQEFYKYDKLVHHHWDQGPWAYGVPESFHQFFTKLLHPLRYPD
jgi:HNH/Endo VII superfamily nuclease toxin with a HHH motif